MIIHYNIFSKLHALDADRLITAFCVVNTVSRLTKACVLRLTCDHLYFVLSGRVASGGVSMWCELSQGNFFDEFQLEGVSADANEIFLEVAPENLSRALKTAQNAKSVKIKLTKKSCPCLTLAAELVSIYLPPLKTMKSVVDRMKNLSNYLVLEANLNGEMNLKIDTDLVSVTTHFKELGNPPWGDDGSQSSSPAHRDPDLMAEARVEIRKLQQFLTGQQVNPSRAMCRSQKGSHERVLTVRRHAVSLQAK
ncbi:hypothetical protein cypCar_00042852, partial [Cyprinus carpio]